VVPVVVIPVILPPQKAVSQKQQTQQPSQQPRVFVALPNTPNVSFSVPSIGTIVSSASLASAPSLNPMQPQQGIASVGNTGSGGDRPEPPYPPLAMQSDEQGTIVLLLTTDAAGNIVSIEVKRSSGYPYLDQETVAFIKNHWHLPTNTDTKIFQTSIIYKLQF
jgi:protein TonB